MGRSLGCSVGQTAAALLKEQTATTTEAVDLLVATRRWLRAFHPHADN